MRGPPSRGPGGRYGTTRSPFLGLLVSVLTLVGLTYLSDLHYLFANLFAIAAVTLWNYTGSLRFAYGTAHRRRPWEKGHRVSLAARDPDAAPLMPPVPRAC